ncbi:unnamed protein product [Pleuronectes platessa]|uniref:Uncharacterized protein n=1 Tax=Pleuronectes platessa TaxID=8262 RepID=A0A9N7TQ62_PLEPL|nr:unnamed protein product [Pleuronectes platessa]
MAVTVGGDGLAGEKSTVKYNAECEGWGYVFQSDADDGPKSPDGAPSVSSPFLPYMYFFVFDISFSIHFNAKILIALLTDISTDKETPCPLQCAHGRDRQAAEQELENCHLTIKVCSRFLQRSHRSLERHQSPASTVTHLGDVFYLGGCWTLRQTSCSGTQQCLPSSEERSLLSLPIREIDIIWTC